MATVDGTRPDVARKGVDQNGLDQALARAADGICAIGPEGRIVVWNRSAERIMGWPARDAIGRPCCDVFVGRDDNGNRLCYQGCHVMALVKMGDPVQSFDMQSRTKAGKAIWLNVSILVIPSADRRGNLTVHLFRDVSAAQDLLTLVKERLAPPPAPSAEASSLTRREIEILRLLAEGVNTRIAAERLHVSLATVRNHVQNILGKLGVHSRLEAVAYANHHRLI